MSTVDQLETLLARVRSRAAEPRAAAPAANSAVAQGPAIHEAAPPSVADALSATIAAPQSSLPRPVIARAPSAPELETDTPTTPPPALEADDFDSRRTTDLAVREDLRDSVDGSDAVGTSLNVEVEVTENVEIDAEPSSPALEIDAEPSSPALEIDAEPSSPALDEEEAPPASAARRASVAPPASGKLPTSDEAHDTIPPAAPDAETVSVAAVSLPEEPVEPAAAPIAAAPVASISPIVTRAALAASDAVATTTAAVSAGPETFGSLLASSLAL